MKLYSFPLSTMGCACYLKFYGETEKKAQSVFDLCTEEANRLDKYYTNFSPNSFTAEINRSSGDPKGIIVDSETAALLDYAHHCYQQSDGLFDLTAGILYRAWNFQTETVKLPEQNLISELLKRVGWDKVIWENPKLILPISGMLLDFGGIVKEYAADRLAQICLDQDISHGFINMSGDIKVLGPHYETGEPWTIHIKNPRENTLTPAAIQISQGALATSGDYERCVFINNKRYCHILNPKTGWPVFGLSSVTAVTDLCIVAGTVTTTALLKGKEQGLMWLSSLNIPYICYDNCGNQVGIQLQ